MMIIIKRIVFGVTALIWAVITILAEQRLEETRSANSMVATCISVFIYAGCSLIALE